MFFQVSLRCYTKIKATLKLKSDSKPISRPKRPLSYAALATVENELNRLQQAGVIQPINYSSWAALIVMVKKANGKVHLCAIFSTGLNDALEDLFRKLNGGTCFAKLDLADANLKMEVDEDSKNLLKMNTHTQRPISILPPSIWRQVSTSNFSINNGYNAHRIARCFRLHWWHHYYRHNPRGTSAPLNLCWIESNNMDFA